MKIFTTDKDVAKLSLKHPIHFLALGFGSGLLKFAPGTFGTIVAIPLYLICAYALTLPWYLFVTLIVTVFGIYICDKAANDMQVHDHGSIVWDEIAGYFITMIAAPLDFKWVIIGFILFRIFDIIKPWPIKVIDEKVKGGFGIMLDDVIAGIFAAICLQITIYLIQIF